MGRDKVGIADNDLGAKSVVRAGQLCEMFGRNDIAEILTREGRIERVSRGVYVVTGSVVTEKHGLAVAGCRAPQAVVALVSALRFHGLTTQNPASVWLAVAAGVRTPKLAWPPVRVVHMGAAALRAGVETHHVEGVAIRVFNAAKTVADCFKFRGQVGLDVAIEALRDGWRMRRFTMAELDEYSRVNRMANVMRPYLESLA